MGSRDYIQLKSREEALERFKSYITNNTNKDIILTQEQLRSFKTGFDMGWKAGRKRERRVNFKYLLKTKYKKTTKEVEYNEK